MRNLIVNEFQGKLSPGNPNAVSVWGVKAYPSVLDVPDPVDLAIVAIPAEAALDAIEDCARKGVRGLVVITAGVRGNGGVGGGREAGVGGGVLAPKSGVGGPDCLGVGYTAADVHVDVEIG